MENGIISIKTAQDGEQKVSARELHKALESKKRFSDWWKQQSLKFDEGIDFTMSPESDIVIGNGAVRKLNDYMLTVEMAKHIAMMSGTDKGKQVRNYFIEVEKQFNSPEAIVSRALQIVNAKALALEQKTVELEEKIEKDKPKVEFANVVSDSSTLISVGELAKLISQNGFVIGQNKLFDYLRLTKRLQKNNVPYQKFIDRGIFSVKESSYTDYWGEKKLSLTTKITGKGQRFFVNEFINNHFTPEQVSYLQGEN